MMVDSGRVPDGTGLSQAEPASRLGPSGFDPSRVEEAIQGHEQVADYFGADPLEAATHLAWHAGYNAGATEHAAHEAGYAQAERDIMRWLMGPGPDRDNGGPCRHVEHAQGYCACAELAECISRAAHRDSDGSPEGRDREDGRDAKHVSAGPKDIAQATPGDPA